MKLTQSRASSALSLNDLPNESDEDTFLTCSAGRIAPHLLNLVAANPRVPAGEEFADLFNPEHEAGGRADEEEARQ